MSFISIALTGFLLAFIFSLYFVPLMRKAALKWGVVDAPDGRLKDQKEPVPYLGGVGIYLSFLLALSIVFDFSPQVLGLLLAGTIMLLIGLVDDFGVLSPFQKLMGQFLASVVLVKSGIYIQIEWLPLWVTIPITFFWLLAVINAVNIIDIMDGLSSSVALSAALVLFAVAAINGHSTIGVLTLTLAGSLAGFLIFNAKPAKIYMGDTGSLFIGLMLGALAMSGSYTQENQLGFLTPLIILGVPLFDTLFVMIVRKIKGLPMFLGSPDHYALRLKRKGLGVNAVVLISSLSGLMLGGIGIANMFLPLNISAIMIASLFLLAFISMFLLYRLK